jgi:hypothetical protein
MTCAIIGAVIDAATSVALLLGLLWLAAWLDGKDQDQRSYHDED